MLAFDQLLRRHFWVVPLTLSGVVATFHARGVAALIGAGLGADEKQLAAAPPAVPGVGTASPLPGARSRAADPLVSHNPFDSANVVLKGPVIASDDVAEVPPPDLSDPMAAPACDGVKVLVILASSDPEWSLALFSAPSEKKTVLRRKGGDVAGKQVKFVGWNRVWLTSGSALCQVEILKPTTAAAPPPPPVPLTPPPSSPGGAPAVPPEIAQGIVRVGPTEFNIDRAVVDKILANQADLMKQARIVPEQENGQVVGIRLFGVRADTLLGTLGMENGDRLEKINGFDMASPEKALEAYARLRTADHLTVSVNRRGKPTNLDFNIK